MRLKKLSTIIVASIISAIVLAVCLHKVVYNSNHREISVTVKYEEQFYEKYTMEVGDTLLLLKTPVRDGYEFLGWYADENYTVEFDFNRAITKDTTIYAKLEKL